MAAASGKQYPVAGIKFSVGILAFNTQSRATCHQQHPFIAVLIVPLAVRRRLAGRDDALDTERRPLKQAIDNLGIERPRKQIVVKVSGFEGHAVLRLISAW
jgi:hypothetical protein